VGSHRGDPSPRHLLGASRRYTSFASPREVVALRTSDFRLLAPSRALGRRRIGHCQWLNYRALKESVSFGTGVPRRDAGARHCLPLNGL
jgi:hypothetical protein